MTGSESYPIKSSNLLPGLSPFSTVFVSGILRGTPATGVPSALAAYNGCVPNIPIGTKGESKLLVTPELCINFLGIDSGRVFGTPWLIWHMELTARDSVKALLGAGLDTVGTHVDVRHLAATPCLLYTSPSPRDS